MRRATSLLALGFGAVACGATGPADVSGQYEVGSPSSLQSSCVEGLPADPFVDYWSADHFTGSDVARGWLEVTRDGDLVEVNVTAGPLHDYLMLVVGTSTFTAPLQGDAVDATARGENLLEHDGCVYTVDARLRASFSSLLMSADLTVPALGGVVVSTPRTTDPRCGFDACSDRAFRQALSSVWRD